MKKFYAGIAMFAFILVVFHGAAYSFKERKDSFNKLQIGGWFGPITPLAETGKKVDTALGGGVFVRVPFPWWRYLKFGVDTSYQQFKTSTKSVNEIYFVPLYGNILFQLPIDFAVRFQFKAGMGGGYLYLKPDKSEQWDLIFMAGFEVSFPAGRLVNIGLRIDYLNIYEKYLKDAKYNGHVLNIGITVYFNL